MNLISSQLIKNKYQMSNIDKLLDGASQIFTKHYQGELYFSVLDVKNANSQLDFAQETSIQAHFNIVGGNATGTHGFLTGVFGLSDMPAEF